MGACHCKINQGAEVIKVSTAVQSSGMHAPGMTGLMFGTFHCWTTSSRCRTPDHSRLVHAPLKIALPILILSTLEAYLTSVINGPLKSVVLCVIL